MNPLDASDAPGPQAAEARSRRPDRDTAPGTPSAGNQPRASRPPRSGAKTTVRDTPCASCPYRKGVPSGIWDSTEYAKLPAYDGDIPKQADAGATGLFYCHQADGHLCAGWAGCHGMPGLLAALLNASRLDGSVWGYESPVPLFGSGSEAAAHGMTDLARPSPEAAAAIAKIRRVRAARGMPVDDADAPKARATGRQRPGIPAGEGDGDQ